MGGLYTAPSPFPLLKRLAALASLLSNLETPPTHFLSDRTKGEAGRENVGETSVIKP